MTNNQGACKINTVMNKVYIVFKEEDYAADRLLSIHATEEGAKKECQIRFERLGGAIDPYYWEETEVQP